MAARQSSPLCASLGFLLLLIGVISYHLPEVQAEYNHFWCIPKFRRNNENKIEDLQKTVVRNYTWRFYARTFLMIFCFINKKKIKIKCTSVSLLIFVHVCNKTLWIYAGGLCGFRHSPLSLFCTALCWDKHNRMES